MEKKVIMNILRFCIFLTLANLPFLTMTNLLGIETFLDSFQHPDSYQYLKSNKINGLEQKSGYLILIKPPDQKNYVSEGDRILYRNSDDTIECRIVHSIQNKRGETTYFMAAVTEDSFIEPISEYQILGKTTGMIQDNPWNALSIQIWSVTIEKLNAVSLFMNP